MAVKAAKQLPLTLAAHQKRDMRAQVGALCYQFKNGKLRILLIKSRKRGNWIIPKGWAEPDLCPAQSAAKEAFEEAGIRGHASDQCVGFYTYDKVLSRWKTAPCLVAVFPLLVTEQLEEFPENAFREYIWCSPKKAMELVAFPVLGKLIKSFDPAFYTQ